MFKYNKNNAPVNSDVTGNYCGLNYKFNRNNGLLEFTNGTLNWNGSNSNSSHPFIGTYDKGVYNHPNNINISDIKSIRFDNNVNVSHVTNALGMFSGINDLRSLDLGNNFNTGHVTNMMGMFADNYNLQNIHFGEGFNTSNVTNMSEMFIDDPALQSLNLNYFNTDNVSDMSQMFMGDSALQSLNLSNFNTNHVIHIGAMFESDSDLQSLTFGNNFNTTYVTGDGTSDMFLNSDSGRNLQTIIISSPKTRFSSDANLPTMYKELGNGVTSNIPNDFSQGNVGIFTTKKNFRPTRLSNDQIKNQIMSDQMQEDNDENKEYNDVNTEIDIYNQEHNEYEKRLLNKPVSNNPLLMTELMSASADDSNNMANYTRESTSVSSLSELLSNSSNNQQLTYVNEEAPVVGTTLTASLPSNNASYSSSVVNAEQSISIINSNAESMASNYSNSSLNTYVNAIHSMDNEVVNNGSNYVNTDDSAQMNLSQANSENSIVISLQNDAKSFGKKGIFSSFESINSKLNTGRKLAISYQNAYNSYDHQADSLQTTFDKSVIKDNGSASNDYKIVKNLATSLKPRSIPQPNPYPSSNTFANSEAQQFVDNENRIIESIAGATSSLASSANNINLSDNDVTLINSYYDDNHNLDNNVQSLGNTYLSYGTESAQNNKKASVANLIAESAESVANSENNISENQSASSIANSEGVKAGIEDNNANNYLANASSELTLAKSVSGNIILDLNKADANYQDASSMSNILTSIINSMSASKSSSSSTSASLSMSTSNSLSESTSTSISNSASLSASTSIADSTSSEENVIEDDRLSVNPYFYQANQDANMVMSNAQASLEVQNDVNIISSASRMISSDRLNPNEITMTNANAELFSASSANNHANQIVSNVMFKLGHSNVPQSSSDNVRSDPSSLNNSSNVPNDWNSANVVDSNNNDSTNSGSSNNPNINANNGNVMPYSSVTKSNSSSDNSSSVYGLNSSASASSSSSIASNDSNSDSSGVPSSMPSSNSASNKEADNNDHVANSSKLGAQNNASPAGSTSYNNNSSNSNRFGNRLPQTDESNSEDIALALMLLSAEIGRLGLDSDRKRRNRKFK